MKQIYLSIRISLLIALLSLSKNALAQCSTTHNQNGTNIIINQTYVFGQGFIAECDGNLEYVQFTSNTTGTVSAGNLNIYEGNTVAGTPLYAQSHPSITITQVNDPIRVDITGALSLVQGDQYTFEFAVDNVNFLADLGNGYPFGTAFQNGVEFPNIDIIFSTSITNTLSIDDNYKFNKEINLSPNPTSDFIKVNGLTTEASYEIYNTIGQKVKRGVVLENEKIDIQNLTNGIYVLKLGDGNRVRFIKE